MAKGDAVLISFHSGGEKTVERAAALLALAAKQEGALTPLLVGCAAVVLASAVDRATRVALDYLLQCSTYDSDINADEVRRGLAERTLEGRVRRLPEIISNGMLVMDFLNADGKDIVRLIRYRNLVIDPTDSVIPIELPLPPHPQVDESGCLNISVKGPLPEPRDDAWGALTLADGERFLKAVRIYFDEVINKVGRESLTAGALLSPAMGR